MNTIPQTIVHDGKTYRYVGTDERFNIVREYVNVNNAYDMITVPVGLSKTWGE